MTNRDKYQRAFRALRPSGNFAMEGIDMNRKNSKFSTPRAFAVAAMIALLALGSLSAAFAADLGGIRRAVDIWVNGKKQAAMVEANYDQEGEGGGEAGSYSVTWQDEDGRTHEMGGGGVAYEPDGTERPLTMDEYLEGLNGPDVRETDDGRMIASWYDQAEDITDRFVDGRCRVSLTRDGETLYLIVTLEDGGYSFTSGYDGFEALEAELARNAVLDKLVGGRK